MSILDPEVFKRLENPAKLHADILRSLVISTWDSIKIGQESTMNHFWNHLPDGVTYEDIIAELGDDAAEIFTLIQTFSEFVQEIKPEIVISPPEGIEIVIEQGVVTIKDKDKD